jgi:uncharacterized protein (DUF1919 family)
MKKFSLDARIKHKFQELLNPITGKYRQSRLNNTDFTIISNNCWAGICYEYYGLPKLSPTVGLYFFADEYIKFISDLEKSINANLEFIDISESKYSKELIRRKQQNIPIGILNDIEIVFLHYKNKEVAKEKWARRVDRMNWDNLIYKFSYMNECTNNHIHYFENICSKRGGKHFEFVPHKFIEYKNAFVVEAEADGQIGNDTFYWNRYFDVEAFLNE